MACKEKSCKDKRPIYISEQYTQSPNAQIRKLNNDEIGKYLKEQKQFVK